METIRDQLQKRREVLAYLFFGVLTTAVNTVSYYLLSLTPLGDYWANAPAFLISVAFAYLTNTRFVFRAPFTVANCTRFFTARISGMLLDLAGMAALLTLGVHKLVSKVTVSVLVILFNYLISKFLVYNKTMD